MTDVSGLYISREDIRAYVVAMLPTPLSDWDIDGIVAGVAARCPEIPGHHDDADTRDAQAWLDAHINLGVYFQIVADYQLRPDTNVQANTSDRLATLLRKVADEHPTATPEEIAHLAVQRLNS